MLYPKVHRELLENLSPVISAGFRFKDMTETLMEFDLSDSIEIPIFDIS